MLVDLNGNTITNKSNQMTSNDKLPQEIQAQIKNEAKKLFPLSFNKIEDWGLKEHEQRTWIAGATEWALWKVKHDALHAERNAMQAKMTEMEVGYVKQIQGLVEALELISNKLSGVNDTITNDIESIANKALKQWKDGAKGKEVEGE